GVLARKNACPTGRAERSGRKCVAKRRPFAREPVDVRRLRERMAGAAEVVPAKVIDEDEDDVGLRLRVRTNGQRRYREQQADRDQSATGEIGRKGLATNNTKG